MSIIQNYLRIFVKKDGITYEVGKLKAHKDGSLYWLQPRHKRGTVTRSNEQKGTLGKIETLWFGKPGISENIADHVSFHGSGAIHLKTVQGEYKRILTMPSLLDLRSPTPVGAFIPEHLSTAFNSPFRKNDHFFELTTKANGCAFLLIALPKDQGIELRGPPELENEKRISVRWPLYNYDLLIQSYESLLFEGEPPFTVFIYPAHNRIPYIFALTNDYAKVGFAKLQMLYYPPIEKIQMNVFEYVFQILSTS